MTNTKKRGLLFVTLLFFLMPTHVNASDRVHFYFINNSSEAATFEVEYLDANPCDGSGQCDGCVVSTAPPQGGTDCSGTYTVGSWENSGDVCSFLIVSVDVMCIMGNWQNGNFIVNGTALPDDCEWSINDPSVGPLILDSGSNCNMSLQDNGGGEYSLTYTYQGAGPPPTVMSLPVTVFNQSSLGNTCTFDNVMVYTPAGPISMQAGSTGSISNSDCSSGTPTCTFDLSVPYGSSGAATITDGDTDVGITVSCLPPPMSLPVTTFSGDANLPTACGWSFVYVLNPNGPISISGAGTSLTSADCAAGMSSCYFNFTAAIGAKEATAIVTDGTTDVPIQVSCMPPPPMSTGDPAPEGYVTTFCTSPICASGTPQCCACTYTLYLQNPAGPVSVTGDGFTVTGNGCEGPMSNCSISLQSSGGITDQLEAAATDGVTTIQFTLAGCTPP